MNIVKIDKVDIFKKYQKDIEVFLDETLIDNFPKEFIPPNYSKNKYIEILKYIENKTAIIYFAIEKENLLGWIWAYELNRLKEKRLHITEITVAKNFRGKGIGQKLLQQILNYAEINNYNAIDLMATSNNKKVINFYNKFGFIEERQLMVKLSKESKKQ